ncbi:HlyD family type I secretion periplasmic adaptor subunit [Legionella sp. MW5194]|nr:HlyD family type I secretion periplasmic adaptor subunit [Legionella sp. MW5194]
MNKRNEGRMRKWMKAIKTPFARLYRQVRGGSSAQKLMVTHKIRQDKNKAPLVLNKENDIFLYQTSKNHELFNPSLIKTMSLIFMVILLGFIAIASVTSIKEAAIAKGEIQPQKNIITLQHFDGGVVTKILVKEGEAVSEGQILLTLDGIGVKEDVARVESKNLMLKFQKERLKSALNGETPQFDQYTKDSQLIKEQMAIYQDMLKAANSEKTILTKQLNQQEIHLKTLRSNRQYRAKEIEIATKIRAMYKTLANEGHASKLKMLEEEQRILALNREFTAMGLEIEKLEKSVQEFRFKLNSYDANRKNTLNHQYEQIEEEINENNELIKKLKQKSNRRHLRAPVAGIINARYVNEVGESIYPNKKLFEIVPLNTPLIATLHISPNDIGHVKLGDPVWIKVSAYDYIKYGLIKGDLYHISAGTLNDDKESAEPYYEGKVRLKQNYVVVKNEKKYLMPGMLIKAEIITGERTILEYLLKPIYRSMDSGLVER